MFEAAGETWPMKVVGRSGEDPAGEARAALDPTDVQASREGDEAAFARLVERHEAAVSAWMWRFTRDRNVLADLVQEVFVEVYLSLGSFKGRSSFRTWILSIATRVGYKHWNRKAREKRNVERAALWMRAFREEGESAPSEAAEALFRLFEELPAKERLCLTLFYFEQMSVEEIAKVTGWSVSLVKVRAFRARRRLKSLLAKEGFGGEGHDRSHD